MRMVWSDEYRQIEDGHARQFSDENRPLIATGGAPRRARSITDEARVEFRGAFSWGLEQARLSIGAQSFWSASATRSGTRA
jgi:hypothetical protein